MAASRPSGRPTPARQGPRGPKPAMTWRRWAAWALGMVVFLMVAYYAGRSFLLNAQGPVRLIVYAFSTQEELFSQQVFPAFERQWEGQTGQDLTIEGVFGPSGTLAGQINLDAPADLAVLSNEQHVNWLKLGRRVRRDTEPVAVSFTPMVIVVRPGNPRAIQEFADLAQPGLRLVHPDPRSSGAGDWAVLAEYGSALLAANDPQVARRQLLDIWSNVAMLAPSARAALTLFELGAGDVLVTYEQDALLAQARGVPLEVIVPESTIVAQHVAVVVDDNVTASERAAAEAFLTYLTSGAGREMLACVHLRCGPPPPVDASAPARFFRVEDLGGWPQAYRELVEGLWQEEIAPGLDLVLPNEVGE